MNEFPDWLREQIESAKEDCKENTDFPYSYGAGYDSGVLRTFLDVYEYYIGKPYVR